VEVPQQNVNIVCRDWGIDHILVLSDKDRAVLARGKKLVAAKCKAHVHEWLGPTSGAAQLEMRATIASEL